MRIAYIADGRLANGLYRSVWPLTVLADKHDVRQLGLARDEGRHPGFADTADVLCVHRHLHPGALQMMREAKARGAAVVWDEDDDTGALPRNTNAHKRYGGIAWERRLREMRKMFALADVVTATTPTLAERLRRYGARETAAIENFIPSYYLKRPRERDARVTIGWVAGLEHQMEAQQLSILAHLQRLLDERPEVHVTSIGFSLGLHSERYHNMSFVPTFKLIEEMAAFDIGIAPLLDVAFNRARSNIKVKEYASGGTAWLASPVGPYASFGEQQGGRLVADDRWYEELVRLIERPRERRKLSKRAYRWATSQTIERHAHRWEDLLHDAIERARGAAPPGAATADLSSATA